MRTLPFVKLSPCGNITVLIRNVPLSPAERALAAAELIAPDHLAAEQAGFVDTTGCLPRLDMMGGEFCLNATRALAVLLLQEGRLRPLNASDSTATEKTAEQAPVGDEYGWHEGEVHVSGVDSPLLLRARCLPPDTNNPSVSNRFEASVRLDLPIRPDIFPVERGIWLVRLPGIAHLVLDANQHPLPQQSVRWQEATAQLFTRFGLLDEAAAGCIWLHQPNQTARHGVLQDGDDVLRITPFVRVKATNTTYAETACGSGTLAAAMICWLNATPQPTEHEQPLKKQQEEKTHVLSLMQPGGEALTVRPVRSTSAGGWAVRVGGPVRVLAQGEVFVTCLD